MAKSRMLKTPGAKWPSSPADAPPLLNSKAVARRLPHAIPCLRNCLESTVTAKPASQHMTLRMRVPIARYALCYDPPRGRAGQPGPTLLRDWLLANCRIDVARSMIDALSDSRTNRPAEESRQLCSLVGQLHQPRVTAAYR